MERPIEADDLIWASPLPPAMLPGEVARSMTWQRRDAAVRTAADDATAVFNEWLDVSQYDTWLRQRGFVAIPEALRVAAQAFADTERERLGLRLFD